jgi:hypothetical protein
MKLPEGVLRQHFETALHRGAVIRFEADDLDDPNVPVKFKYAVILSVDCAEASTLYVFTTSQLAFSGRGICVAVLEYPLLLGAFESGCRTAGDIPVTTNRLHDIRPANLTNPRNPRNLRREGAYNLADVGRVAPCCLARQI